MIIIANPIYDVVFKKLMENDKVAKFFIGTLLEQTVESVELKPQELTYVRELAGIAVFRLDFVATIKTDTGEYKKVLIEIQKSKNPTDLMRFRNYLAEQYKRTDIVNNNEEVLPITTVYILGFMLPEIITPCIKVERNYIDLINHTTIIEKSDYVEKLSHDCYIVQVGRITDRYQTRLDKLLSVFEQTNFAEEDRIVKRFNHEPEIEEIKMMTDILVYVASDPEERKQIEIEIEAMRTWNEAKDDFKKEFMKVIEKKDEVIEAKEQEIEAKEQEIEAKEQEIEAKDQEIEAKDKEIEELKRKLKEQ